MSATCAKLHQNSKPSEVYFFSENPNFGIEKHLLRKTTIRNELYGNFGKELGNLNFERRFSL